MASSNRHWPSMFKSKPCNTHPHQWQHDTNSPLISTGFQRSPFSSGSGCEERTPEPKPRWNPKPEQIRILEAIFNSGMVNPPRDEIRKIRAQLQEYGQVGDANVFYWFQNRKSRSKHKQRHLLHSSKNRTPPPSQPITNTTSSITVPSSSSSSSEKSSPTAATTNNKITFSVGSSNPIDLSNSPTGSVNMNQTYFASPSSHGELIMPDPFFFPAQQQQMTSIDTNGNGIFSQGICFSDLSNAVQVPDHHYQAVGSCPGFLLSELMMNNDQGVSKKFEDEKMKLHQHLSYPTTVHVPPFTTTTTTVTAPLNVNQIQGVNETGGMGPLGSSRSTVFINDVAFELAMGLLNVRECFGDNAVLLHSTGQPVLTNEWGVTLQPLQHGAFYYLI